MKYEEKLAEGAAQRIMEYIKRKGGKVIRRHLITSKLLKGGYIEYDCIIADLEAHEAIIIDKTARLKKNEAYILAGQNDN